VHERKAPQSLVAWLVTLLSIATIVIVLVLPLGIIFTEAFAEGAGTFFETIADGDTRSSMLLTLLVVAITVPIHTVFGLAAAWALTRHDFPGKRILATIVDLPFTVSPVVSGLLFVLLFGARGWFGPWLRDHDIRIIYAVPGVIIATLFVTLPFVVRELVPMMEAIGREEEEAAASLGASGLQILWRVTLPRVKWALFYGCVLCAARAAGEFGAVNVVSGSVRGETTTLPLQVEILWGEYNTAGAFAVASLLASSGLITLILKTWLERRARQARQAAMLSAQVMT
jgi:sulfate transport system permease protein